MAKLVSGNTRCDGPSSPGAKGAKMGARYRPVFTTLAVLAFLAACGFVIQRRAAIDNRRWAAHRQAYYNWDAQFRRTDVMLIAASQGNLDVIKRFLPHIPQWEIPNLVNIAGRGGHTAIIAYLFDHGYPPDRIGNGPYLFSIAAAFGYMDIARLLQRRHVVLSATDRQEALTWA